MISSTSKLVLAIVGLTILALAIALVILPTVGAKTNFATYQNKDFHFKIQYPAKWTKEETSLQSNQIVRFYNTYKSLAGFSVVTYQTPANYTLANYAKAPYNASVQILTPGKMITTGNGINAYQIMYYDNGSGYNVKDMDIKILKSVIE